MNSSAMNRGEVLTVDKFNKLTGQETLHPLVGLADLSGDKLSEDLRMPCDFYALVCRQASDGTQASLRLVNPGEMFEIPATSHRGSKGYTGVIFHPDLLCDTPLERCIDDYPSRCRCYGALSQRERKTIADCLEEIGKELRHSIDRHSGTIIVLHIELLLNYCMRFCDV